jgi:hypothetical protein
VEHELASIARYLSLFMVMSKLGTIRSFVLWCDSGKSGASYLYQVSAPIVMLDASPPQSPGKLQTNKAGCYTVGVQ